MSRREENISKGAKNEAMGEWADIIYQLPTADHSGTGYPKAETSLPRTYLADSITDCPSLASSRTSMIRRLNH
jgi:hypothetical protein